MAAIITPEMVQAFVAIYMGNKAKNRMDQLRDNQYKMADEQIVLAEELHARQMSLRGRDGSLFSTANGMPIYGQQYACQRSRAHADAMRTAHKERVTAHKNRSKYQIGVGREIELTTMVAMGTASVSKQVNAEFFEDIVHDESVSDRIRAITSMLTRAPSFLVEAYRSAGSAYQQQYEGQAAAFNGALETLGYATGSYLENRAGQQSADESFGVKQSDAGPTKSVDAPPALLQQDSAGKTQQELITSNVSLEDIT